MSDQGAITTSQAIGISAPKSSEAPNKFIALKLNANLEYPDRYASATSASGAAKILLIFDKKLIWKKAKHTPNNRTINHDAAGQWALIQPELICPEHTILTPDRETKKTDPMYLLLSNNLLICPAFRIFFMNKRKTMTSLKSRDK